MTMRFGSAHMLAGMYDVTEISVASSLSAPVQLCPADPNRVSLIFSVTSGTTAICTTAPTNSPLSGVLLTQQTPSFQMTIHDYPDLVQRAWWTPTSGGGVQISVFTVSEHPTSEASYD